MPVPGDPVAGCVDQFELHVGRQRLADLLHRRLDGIAGLDEDAALQKLGAEVLTVSTDTKFTHLAWQRHEGELANVTYPMAADRTGAVAKLFGVYMANGLALRGTFIIGPDGKLRGELAESWAPEGKNVWVFKLRDATSFELPGWWRMGVLPPASQQALAQAHAEGVALGDAVCAHALRFARGIVPTEVALEVFAIDRQGNLVGQACEERR